MPVESFATQTLAFAVESAYGTYEDPDKRILSGRMPLQANVETESFTPSGYTAATVVAVNDDYTTGEFTGKPDYNAIGYILQSFFGAPTTTTLTGTPSAYKHVFTYNAGAALTPVSYSVAYGKGALGRRTAGFVFNRYGFSVNRGGIDFTSGGFGKALVTGVDMSTLTLTDVPPKLMFPLHFGVFAESTFAALATPSSRLLYVYDFGIEAGERLARTRPVNDALTSDDTVETEDAAHTVSMTLGADSTADAYLGNLRAGSTIYVALRAKGDLISGTNYYQMLHKTAIKLTSADAYQSNENVHVLPLSGQIVQDSTAGKAIEIELINTHASYAS